MKFVVGILFLIRTISLAQESSSRNPVLLDPASPSVYLQFDRLDKRTPVHSGETGNVVRLTLHNNARGAISLCTESLYIGPEVSALKLWSGKSVLALRDGTEAAACYSVEHEVGSTAFEKGGVVTTGAEGEYRVVPGAGGDVSSTSWVPSGSSIVISVRKEDLGIGFRVRVRFNYEWEPNARDEAHIVFFQSSELPK